MENLDVADLWLDRSVLVRSAADVAKASDASPSMPWTVTHPAARTARAVG